jgi:hypothetical protein
LVSKITKKKLELEVINKIKELPNTGHDSPLETGPNTKSWLPHTKKKRKKRKKTLFPIEEEQGNFAL